MKTIVTPTVYFRPLYEGMDFNLVLASRPNLSINTSCWKTDLYVTEVWFLWIFVEFSHRHSWEEMWQKVRRVFGRK